MAEAEVDQQAKPSANGIGEAASAAAAAPENAQVYKTKVEYRRKVWEYLERNRLAKLPRPVYGRIPNFIGTEEAAQRLQELDVFKKAKNVEVNPDKPQEAARIMALESGKTLYVPVPRLTEGLLKHISAPENATASDLKELISRKGIEENGKAIGLKDKISIDVFVLGSVAVSKKGQRIGKGRGFADLEYAILVEMGAVKKDTIIATIVHDNQVFDAMPEDIFKPYDVPVDYIVTPTQVIKVEKPLERPTGIFWNLISSRRLALMPILQALKEKLSSEGKDVTLKEEDTDVESYDRRPIYRYRRFPRIPRPRRDSKTDEAGAGDAATNQKRKGRSFFRRRLPQQAAEGATPVAPINGTEIPATRPPRRSFRKSRPKIDFSLEVRNIEKTVRVRDLKNALSEHGIKPNVITWRGYKGFCLLHYGKFKDRSSREEKPSVPVDKVIDILKNMKIKPDSETNLAVKIMEPQPASSPISRIETTDVTAV